MAEKGNSVTDSWPKWQTALAVGTPVALGLAGLWYYKRRKSRGRTTKDDKAKKGRGESKGSKSGTSENDNVTQDSSLIGDAATKEKLSPIEQAQASKNKGNKYFKGGKYDQAIKCYTEAINVCPPDSKMEIATFYQNRAAAYEQLKNYDCVIEDCTHAVKLNAKYIKALMRRARAYEITGKLMSCLEDATAVTILEGFQNQQTLMMADRVLKDMGQAKAKEAFKNRKPVKPSPQFIRTYYSSFAHDPVLQYTNGSSQASSIKTSDDSDTDMKEIEVESPPGMQGEPEKHQDETSEKDKMEGMEKVSKREEVKLSPYRQAVECFHNHDYEDIVHLCSMEVNLSNMTYAAEALLLRATFYLLRGEGNKSMEDFDKLLEMDVDKRIKSNALIKRGSLHMQQGQKERALSDFQTAIDIDPENSDIFHHRGQLYLLTENIEDAIKDFEKSLELSPNFDIANVQKCYTDYRLAFHRHSPLQLQKATKSFEDIIERFPDCSEGYALYGQALCDQQLFEKADENFKKSIELEPGNGNTYVHRGLLRLQWKQEIDEAAELISKAIEVDEKCEFAYETLATIEVQRGNLDKARKLFDMAINLAKTEIEMAHLYSLLDAALAQARVTQALNITIPSIGQPLLG